MAKAEGLGTTIVSAAPDSGTSKQFGSKEYSRLQLFGKTGKLQVLFQFRLNDTVLETFLQDS